MDEIKLIAGGYKILTKMWKEQGDLYFQFPFSRPLMAEIKMMAGSKYHGYDQVNPRKLWSVHDCPRNHFQLAYLQGQNPYARYDLPLLPVNHTHRYNKARKETLPLFKHQPEMIGHMITRRGSIVAGEMGTCKTLSMIIAVEMEEARLKEKHGPDFKYRWWYVGPRSALRAVERDFIIWGLHCRPEKFLTYEGNTKEIKNWSQGQQAPYAVWFDESSKLKNHTSQRAQAAQALADGIRRDHPDDWLVCLMTGTPAPKSPLDWWSQAEIACPGFLREGDIFKFKSTLAIIKETKGIDGVYPRLVGYRDDTNKCTVCGEPRNAQQHHAALVSPDDFHAFVPCVNEVDRLYRRLKGLVIIYFKKDCLDLPDKHYKIIEVKPSSSVLRVASVISKTASTTIEGLTRLRELSDGFQYIDEKVGTEECIVCKGGKRCEQPKEVPGTCPNCKNRGFQSIEQDKCLNHQPQYTMVMDKCAKCQGTGQQIKYQRKVQEVQKCPKDDVLLELLDEHDEIGRLVVYAGFTGSVERCSRICQRAGWHVIQLNAGKEQILDPKGSQIKIDNYLTMFQDMKDKYPRVCLVAHPGSAGMGLTLTASPTIFYYSNDFNAESRIQSEDRIHRPGMDVQKGATIIDVIHLPSDLKVLDNLKRKRDLQSMTLGDFKQEIAATFEREVA